MKKAFVLLFTLVLITLISILSIYFYEIKAINSTNLVNQYLYIQGQNHLNFLSSYIKSIKDFQNLKEIKIEDGKFHIKAIIKKEQNKKLIELFVYSKTSNIKLYKKLIIE